MDAYSKEFRRDVLAACDTGGGTREVALQFGVSESWVRRVKQERREQGKVAPRSTRDRRKSWEPHAAWLLAKLAQVTLLELILDFFGAGMIRKFNVDGARIVEWRCSEDLFS